MIAVGLIAAVVALVAWRPLAAWWGDDVGNRALLRGDERGAQAWFERSLQLEPNWALLHEDRGRAILNSDPAGALAEFDRAACGAPCTAEAGDALVRMGRPKAAVDRYIDAKAVSRVSSVAMALAARGEYDAASALMESLIGRLRNDFLERADLATSYATLGQIHDDAAKAQPARAGEHHRAAIEAFAAATQLAPYNEGFLLSYAFAQMQWGNRNDARRAFVRLLEIHPDQPDAEAALARLGPAPTSRSPLASP